MRVLDPGHTFALRHLDDQPGAETILPYVKREGNKYPGNVGTQPGTTIQETLRADISRLRYLDRQKPCADNKKVIYHLERSIFYLERRAARQHGRKPPTVLEACYGLQCSKCLHVGCPGDCHA